MKLKKIKNYILTFIICLFGAFAFNSIETKAIGFNPKLTVNEIQNSNTSVWEYNGVVYSSLSNRNYYFDVDTQTWNNTTWTGNINGQNVRVMNGKAYSLNGSVSSQLIFNDDTQTWTINSFGMSVYGQYVWYDQLNNYYFSNGSSHYLFDLNNNTLSQVTFTGITNFYGNQIKCVGNYCYTTYDSYTYRLEKGTLNWVQYTNSNPSVSNGFNGTGFWVYDNNLYFTNNGTSISSTINPTYILNLNNQTWEQVNDFTGFKRFAGSYVFNVNNIPNIIYQYTQYELNYVSGGNITEEDLENAYQEGYNDGLISTDAYQEGYQAGYNAGYTENNSIPNIYISNSHMIYSTDIGGVQVPISNYINGIGGKLDFNALLNFNFPSITTNPQQIIVDITLLTDISVNDVLEFTWAPNTNDTLIMFGLCNTNPCTQGAILNYNDIVSNNNRIVLSEINPDIEVESINHLFMYLYYSNGILYGPSTITDISLTANADTNYDIGYKVGYIAGEEAGINTGRAEGYNLGYNAGLDYAFTNENTITGLVGTLFTMPVNMFKSIFDFEFLGVNLTAFFLSLITLLVVIWLIKKFI